MAKDRIPKDRASELLGVPREDAKRTPREPSSDAKRTSATVELKESDLKSFTIRLRPEDKRILQDHFARRSVPLGQGIRGILLDFMEEKGLK